MNPYVYTIFEDVQRYGALFQYDPMEAADVETLAQSLARTFP